MASDFGDEAGEKLFDWMLRIGQDAGEQVMVNSAKHFKDALKKARQDAGKEPGEEWAKLNMEEFKDLPEYDSIKEIISEKLKAAGIEHDYYHDKDGKDWLLFRVEAAQEVSRAFEELEQQTDQALERAQEAPELVKAREIDLDAPATEKQSKFVDSLREQGIIPEEEYKAVMEAGLTKGSANELLNKYAHYLKLGDREPLDQRAERAREGSKAIAEKNHVERDIELAEVHAK